MNTAPDQKSPIVIIGGGGREHALAWKLRQSSNVGVIYVAPGNGGTNAPTQDIINLEIDTNNHLGLTEFCQDKGVKLVVIGPEAPLAAGLSDALSKADIPCFGPSQAAAQLESSKAFAKAFMKRHHIPTAKAASFESIDEAKRHIDFLDGPCVVKASGLAAGKGVILCDSAEKAKAAVESIMSARRFGEAGATVVIEEMLEGQEVSVLAFCDGQRAVALPAAQDHKRLRDGDEGPNTGGMGAYAPAPIYTPEIAKLIQSDVLDKTLKGCREDGMPFVGILFVGLMLTDKGPRVLEYNCRFGDPETQTLLPLLDSDLFAIMTACIETKLRADIVKVRTGSVATVVAASGGYPDAYSKGLPITGVEQSLSQTRRCFHAGTRVGDSGQLLTSGGRVLAISAYADSLEAAISDAYAGIQHISFDGMHTRSDIGWRAKPQRATYRDAGVDLEAGAQAVAMMKASVEATHGPEVLAGVGAFGGLFDIAALVKGSVLVASTDGVGTKTKVAAVMGSYSGLGYDIVNHCINDILVQGARPLFFLDYVATSALDPEQIASVVQSCAAACGAAGCALLGGETAEMPGVYTPGALDVVGTVVGVVDRDKIIDGSRIAAGDQVIGIGSSGLHTNGYSLARRVLADQDWEATPAELAGMSIGEALLQPHKSYLGEVQALLKAGVDIKGLAHITGGGLIDNPPRILPDNVTLELKAGSWQRAPIFDLIEKLGAIEEQEMNHVFNNGLGMLVIVPQADRARALQILEALDSSESWLVGRAAWRSGRAPVVFEEAQ